MPFACAPPDADLGIALRLSTFLDCQGRALGENGFQAIAGGPVATGLLSGLVTIFVALIGYRLILGHTPSVRDGVSWAARLGIVLTLTTSWPAFQVLFYRVAVDAPGELATVLLSASGLPAEGMSERVQAIYDTMRLGSGTPIDAAVPAAQPIATPNGQGQPPTANQPSAATPAGIGQPPLPQTASLFVLSIEGIAGGLRVAIGFLLAIGPLFSLALLFDATLGLFSGWIRALAGAIMGLLATMIVAAMSVLTIEGELAKLQTFARGGIAEVVDQQALTTITLVFAVVIIIVLVATGRVCGAFRLPLPRAAGDDVQDRSTPEPRSRDMLPSSAATLPEWHLKSTSQNDRALAVSDALAAAIRREQPPMATGHLLAATGGPSRASVLEPTTRVETSMSAPLGVAGRRSLPRRTRSAAARDRT